MKSFADNLLQDGVTLLLQQLGRDFVYTDENGQARTLIGAITTVHTVQVLNSAGGIQLRDEAGVLVSKDPATGVAAPNPAATITIDQIVYNIDDIQDNPAWTLLGIVRIRPQEVGLGQHG